MKLKPPLPKLKQLQPQKKKTEKTQERREEPRDLMVKALSLTAVMTAKKLGHKHPLLAKCVPSHGVRILYLQRFYQKTVNNPSKRIIVFTDKKFRYHYHVQLGRGVVINLSKYMGDVNVRLFFRVILAVNMLPMPMTTFFWYDKRVIDQLYARKIGGKPPCPNGIYDGVIKTLSNAGGSEILVQDDRVIPHELFLSRYKQVVESTRLSLGIFYVNTHTVGGLLVQNVGAYTEVGVP